MAEILHQVIGCVSHYLQGFIHPRWLAGFLPSTVPVTVRFSRVYPPPVGLVGWRIELARVCSSQLERVGLQLWAGALVLSDFLLARPYLLEKQHVCELGAGWESQFGLAWLAWYGVTPWNSSFAL